MPGDPKVVAQLAGLGDETDFAFEQKLTALFEKRKDQFDDDLKPVLVDGSVDESVQYAAFYGLSIYFRRQFEATELRRLMDDHGDRFSAHPTYPHLKSLYLLMDPDRASDASHCASLANSNTHGEHAGVLHNYALTLVTLEEQSANEPDAERLRTAESALNEAISRTQGEYGRYFSTRARLLTLLGRFGEAREAIEEAIDKETPGTDDYAIRLGGYEGVKLRIQFRQYSDHFQKRMEAVLSRFEESRLEMVQLLGLLAAVIAFLVTTLEVARAQTLDEGARLLVLMTGSVLIIFSAFGLVLQPDRQAIRKLLVFAVGLAIGALALYAWQPID